MTTDPHEEFGEILRRALRAEADSVVPAPDGLERIRARVDERSQRRFAWNWFSTGGWQRPALALGVAAFIVALGVSAPQTFDRITSAGGKGPAGQGGPPPAAGSGPGTDTQPTGSPQPTDPARPGSPATGGRSPSLPNVGPGGPTCTPVGKEGTTTVQAPSSPPATDSGDARTKLPPCPPSGDKPSPNPTDPVTSEPKPSPSEVPTTPSPQQEPPAPGSP